MFKTNQQPSVAMNVDDIIQATVGAMILYERNRSNNEVRNVDSPIMHKPSNSELSDLLPEFSGVKNVMVWLEWVDSVQGVYQLKDEVFKLIAMGKFIGQTKKWYLGKSEFIFMDWKNEMKKMFNVRKDIIYLRRDGETEKK